MRIGFRIFIVGAAPILIGAAITLSAVLLLHRVDRARTGASVAGTVYRTLLTAVMARNDYLGVEPASRVAQQRRFFALTAQARGDLDRLRGLESRNVGLDEAQAILARYAADMHRLIGGTTEGDALARDMAARAATLIRLTDAARERQHVSNADVASSLAEDDARLRVARDILDSAQAIRLLLASIEVARAAPASAAQDRRALAFDVPRLKRLVGDLADRLRERSPSRPSGPGPEDEIRGRVGALPAGLVADGEAGDAIRRTLADAARWSDGTIKAYSAEYHSLHEAAAQLLIYSVQAHDIELATQNVAMEILKLSGRSDDATARRNAATARDLLAEGKALTGTIAALPISPLIQSDMAEAYRRWIDGLASTADRIERQNTLITAMDLASDEMVRSARALDATFSRNADGTASSIRLIMVIGSAVALLFGGAVAAVVARSITRPLGLLQTRITRRAHDPSGGLIGDGGRRDELGDIARAADTFLVQIARREQALIAAKERTDRALDRLKRTQAELIQAEKLASLGQLVAGVAHEINTPIGIALTTAGIVDEEAHTFRDAAREGRISRSSLDRAAGRVAEGAGLLVANLTRAADLIQSFKRVAADQVSGERRSFALRVFLHELLTSLGPMLRQTGRSARMECPDDLVLDSYPGALAQVVTNLVVNASLHAFPEGDPGLIVVAAERFGPDAVRLTVSDDGCGIPPERAGKVFDPFFTTRRGQGSTGLGLHIVWNLVTGTLGGHVALESMTGCGSRFVVDLPFTAAPRERAPALLSGEVHS